MNALASVEVPETSLVDVIELKWLLAGEGIYLHVERMLSDDDYAGRVLARAAASPSAVLRAAAERLRARLQHG